MPVLRNNTAKLEHLLGVVALDIERLDQVWRAFVQTSGEADVTSSEVTQRLKQAQVVKNALNKCFKAIEQWEVRLTVAEQYPCADVREGDAPPVAYGGDDPGGRHLPV